MFKSVLKFTAKATGTVILTAAGIASSVVEKAAEQSGNYGASEVFGSAKRASLNKIKGMWSDEDIEELESENLEQKKRVKLEVASNCRKMAEAASKAGNFEKAEQLMSRSKELHEEVAELDMMIRDARIEEEKEKSRLYFDTNDE